jgi:hypothetical protein
MIDGILGPGVETVVVFAARAAMLLPAPAPTVIPITNAAIRFGECIFNISPDGTSRPDAKRAVASRPGFSGFGRFAIVAEFYLKNYFLCTNR